jgi:hypothetical protein
MLSQHLAVSSFVRQLQGLVLPILAQYPNDVILHKAYFDLVVLGHFELSETVLTVEIFYYFLHKGENMLFVFGVNLGVWVGVLSRFALFDLLMRGRRCLMKLALFTLTGVSAFPYLLGYVFYHLFVGLNCKNVDSSFI